MKRTLTPEQAREELLRREAGKFNPGKTFFPKQLAFFSDPSPFKVASCSRRAGKSTEIAAELALTARDNPDCTSLYITGTKVDAKKIIWDPLLKFNEKEKLNGTPNISELTLSLPNGSIVRLAGAATEADVAKLRGVLPPLKKAFIDEAQSIRDSVLEPLIDDILEPALLDYGGSLSVAGTPSPVPVGYFYRICHDLDKNSLPLKESVWSKHHWTFFDNPFIAIKSKTSHETLLARVLKRRGVGVSHPSIQREYFGRWSLDTDSLVYQYNPQRNHYDVLPIAKYVYIMGIDLGFNDADAIAILAWSDSEKCVYLVDEIVTRKQGITELVEQVELLKRRYDVSKIVIDTGGLGKKISEEMSRRYLIHCQPAEKVRKTEFIELMNDAMRTNQLKAKSSSKFAQDCFKVEWDTDKSTPDKKVISDRYHSDICEAVLYAWRECYAFTYTPQIKAPELGSKEYLEDLERQAEEYFTAIEEADRNDPYRE